MAPNDYKTDGGLRFINSIGFVRCQRHMPRTRQLTHVNSIARPVLSPLIHCTVLKECSEIQICKECWKLESAAKPEQSSYYPSRKELHLNRFRDVLGKTGLNCLDGTVNLSCHTTEVPLYLIVLREAAVLKFQCNDIHFLGTPEQRAKRPHLRMGVHRRRQKKGEKRQRCLHSFPIMFLRGITRLPSTKPAFCCSPFSKPAVASTSSF